MKGTELRDEVEFNSKTSNVHNKLLKFNHQSPNSRRTRYRTLYSNRDYIWDLLMVPVFCSPVINSHFHVTRICAARSSEINPDSTRRRQ